MDPAPAYPSRVNNTSLMIDRRVHEALRVASFHEGRSGKAITHEAIIEWLDRHGHELPEGWVKIRKGVFRMVDDD